ncbi:ATP-binding protein [Actinacidiphila glaucinigra]|uniref:ATP-binding protein n=1 Tax=Actinacidiphila glaucinigra TaxID=235986 RepID=UPI003D92D456
MADDTSTPRALLHEESMALHMNTAVFWTLAVCLLAASGASLRLWRVARSRHRHIVALQQDLLDRDEEAAHLVRSRLPAAAEAAYSRGVPVPSLLHPHLLVSPFGHDLESATQAFSAFVDTARKRADRAAQASLAAAMKALQGLANEQQRAISAMQERHDDPEVLQGLLEVDHMNAQIGRRAQAIAVLSGSWPGRQRASSPVLAVVRGATSRIRDYRRVRIRGQADLAVVSRAVEPTVLAVAELLDNAARHSQPDSPIEVSIQSAHNGVSVVIDDCGVGMLDDEIRQAATLLSGERNVDVTRLGDPPSFGHAVVGRLAARYGFRAYADSASPFGGLRAVIFLPSALLVPVSPASSPAPVHAVGPERENPPASQGAAPAGPPAAPSPAGLPQRRRRSPTTEHTQASAGEALPASSARTGRQDAARLGAFQRGTRAGRAVPTPRTDGPSTDGRSDDTERQSQ